MARIEQVLAGEATWAEWRLDQWGHVGLGAIYGTVGAGLGVFVLHWGMWASLGLAVAFAAFGGIVREVYQLGKTGKLHWKDRVVDAVFHIPGAPVGFALIAAARAIALAIP